MRVLFIAPYPAGRAASQRFRVEQLFPILRRHRIKYKLTSFWNHKTWAILYKQGNWLQRGWGLLTGFMNRLLLLPRLPLYSFVFIHREATPVGPPWFEWIAANVFRRKIIFDFDDAIWLTNPPAGNRAVAKLKWHRKVEAICRWSYKISCGNEFLQAFALKYNRNTVLLPTLIDTEHYHNKRKQQSTQKICIGWTGSHSTLPYLKLIEPVLQQLEQKHKFDFVVIADKAPDLKLQSLKYVSWCRETEIQDLLQLNIGIMPLPDTDWARGKCAFKALQYMALGIPAVVSAVGANIAAVPDGVAGFVCHTEEDWHRRLEELLLDEKLRATMGKAARLHVQQHYAVQAHQQTFLELFS